MEKRTAKEFIHLRDWLGSLALLIAAGKDAYQADSVLQEAGDSLMMKIGEGARRLACQGVAPPDGVRWAEVIANRNWLIHEYDQIDRDITWATLTRDLPAYGWPYDR